MPTTAAATTTACPDSRPRVAIKYTKRRPKVWPASAPPRRTKILLSSVPDWSVNLTCVRPGLEYSRLAAGERPLFTWKAPGSERKTESRLFPSPIDGDQQRGTSRPATTGPQARDNVSQTSNTASPRYNRTAHRSPKHGSTRELCCARIVLVILGFARDTR